MTAIAKKPRTRALPELAEKINAERTASVVSGPCGR